MRSRGTVVRGRSGISGMTVVHATSDINLVSIYRASSDVSGVVRVGLTSQWCDYCPCLSLVRILISVVAVVHAMSGITVV